MYPRRHVQLHFRRVDRLFTLREQHAVNKDDRYEHRGVLCRDSECVPREQLIYQRNYDERKSDQPVFLRRPRHQQLQNYYQQRDEHIQLAYVPLVAALVPAVFVNHEVQRIKEINKTKQQRRDKQQIQYAVSRPHQAVFHLENSPHVLPELVNQNNAVHIK